MEKIAAATNRVRRWRIAETVLFWASLTLPWVAASLMRLAGHKGIVPGMVVGAIALALWGAYVIAINRCQKAIADHPLAFLVRVREAFGKELA